MNAKLSKINSLYSWPGLKNHILQSSYKESSVWVLNFDFFDGLRWTPIERFANTVSVYPDCHWQNIATLKLKLIFCSYRVYHWNSSTSIAATTTMITSIVVGAAIHFSVRITHFIVCMASNVNHLIDYYQLHLPM